MPRFVDRSSDWVAALTMLSGAAVIVPSLTVLTITLLTVAASIFF